MDELDAPRWPVAKAVFPSAIKSFGQCPRRVRLMYIDKAEGKKYYSVFLDKGLIAHDILRRQAALARAGKPFLDEEWIARHAFDRLPNHEYPTSEIKQSHANDIVRWARYGLRLIDRAAEFLVIERYEIEKWSMDTNQTFSFGARPDVIMLRRDERGEQFVEFVDYKTGKPYDDPITPLLTRSVFRKLISNRLGDLGSIRMIFTWSWLDQSYSDIVELDKQYYEVQWPMVAGELRSLVEERQWIATPSFLCNYCPYQGNHCDQGNGPFASDSWE
jgi:hypothetical protein